ncbi:unnamed protein product, partial [Scytosiphon promiscuus]
AAPAAETAPPREKGEEGASGKRKSSVEAVSRDSLMSTVQLLMADLSIEEKRKLLGLPPVEKGKSTQASVKKLRVKRVPKSHSKSWTEDEMVARRMQAEVDAAQRKEKEERLAADEQFARELAEESDDVSDCDSSGSSVGSFCAHLLRKVEFPPLPKPQQPFTKVVSKNQKKKNKSMQGRDVGVTL